MVFVSLKIDERYSVSKRNTAGLSAFWFLLTRGQFPISRELCWMAIKEASGGERLFVKKVILELKLLDTNNK